VIKADGLAAGKGVILAATRAEAEAAIDMMFEGGFGAAGAEVVIEECLVGEEVSFFAISDGEAVVPFGSAQDHKRVGDGDIGPNTGGMGAYSPASVLTPDLEARVLREIVEPTIRAMAQTGTPYSGVLFAGLMLTADGPSLIEYNVRFGDPECQVLMVRLESDLLELMLATAKGELARSSPPHFSPAPALTVVMAANGYPGTPEKGGAIDLAARVTEGVRIFHAGTALRGDELVANGGRVLAVTALAPSVAEARDKAYAAIDRIGFPGGFFRRDIGWRELQRSGHGLVEAGE
jgi:phosphoribosylamine--glycine ligase